MNKNYLYIILILLYVGYLGYIVPYTLYTKYYKKNINTITKKDNLEDLKKKETFFSTSSYLFTIGSSVGNIIIFYFLLLLLQNNSVYNYNNLTSRKRILYILVSVFVIISQLYVSYPKYSETIKFLLYIPSFILLSYVFSYFSHKNKNITRILIGYILIFFYISLYLFCSVLRLDSDNFIIRSYIIFYILIGISTIRSRFVDKESYSNLKYIIGSIIVFFFVITQFITNRIIACKEDTKANKRLYLPKTMYILFVIMFIFSMVGESSIFCSLKAKKETLQHNSILYYIIKYRILITYFIFTGIGVFSSGLAAMQCKGGLLENPIWVNNYLRFMKICVWFHFLLGHFKSSSIFLLLLFATLPSCVKKKCTKENAENSEKASCDNKEYDYVYNKMNVLFIIHVPIWIYYIGKFIKKKV